jgi:hypothetical protein
MRLRLNGEISGTSSNSIAFRLDKNINEGNLIWYISGTTLYVAEYNAAEGTNKFNGFSMVDENGDPVWLTVRVVLDNTGLFGRYYVVDGAGVTREGEFKHNTVSRLQLNTQTAQTYALDIDDIKACKGVAKTAS